MHRFVRWLLVLALSLSIGLQWAVVQGAAWVGMIVSYSKEATISQSLTMTFDGRHPCELCKVAQKGDSTQEKQNADNPVMKLTLAAPEHDEFIFERPRPVEPKFVTRDDRGFELRPPVPPPRPV